MFKIALFSATLMVSACKKADQPAPTAEPVAKVAAAAKPGDPSAKPGDPSVKPADPAAPAATGNNELQNKGIAMMYRMGEIFAANTQDCEKLATELKAFVAQSKPLLGQLTAMEKQQTEQERAAFEARNRPAQAEVMKKVTPAMTACGENTNVLAAMKEFSEP
jgi:hypothetical protein